VTQFDDVIKMMSYLIILKLHHN